MTSGTIFLLFKKLAIRGLASYGGGRYSVERLYGEMFHGTHVRRDVEGVR